MLTQVIVTFRSTPVCSRISCNQSASTTCTYEIIDCGNAFALGWSFEPRMGTPTRQNINRTWLFDEVTEEFSGNTLSSDNELLLTPFVQPAHVDTACDALLLTVSTQEHFYKACLST